MVAHEEEQVRKCQDLLNYGESEDPAKMTDSKMAQALGNQMQNHEPSQYPLLQR